MPETNAVFSGNRADIGHRLLHGLQYRIVPATGAPAHFLVGLEVFGGEGSVHYA